MALATSPRPLSTRPVDAVYVVWFGLHLLVMFNVDLVPIYPRSLAPQYLYDVRQWYIDTHHDRFFVNPPAWFSLFMWMELFYHVPVSLWAIPALIRDDPMVPVQLLIWSVQTFITTFVCIYEFFNWPDVTSDELKGLSSLYGPYCFLAALMGIDTLWRLQKTLNARPSIKKTQ